MVGFQLHGVDKSTWYRLPPACADKDHFYGLQHLVRPRFPNRLAPFVTGLTGSVIACRMS